MNKLHNVILAALVAVTGSMGAAVGLYELSRETSPPRAAFLMAFDISEDGQARQAVDRGAKPKNYADAANLAKTALALSAYNNNARLRLAYIEVLQHGVLTPVGERYLAQSYDLAPYDPLVASWRVKFALELWEHLTPSTRQAVETEAKAFLRSSSRVANMRQTLASIQDQDGRLAATLWLMDAS